MQKYVPYNKAGVPTSGSGMSSAERPWVNISQTGARNACTSLGAGYHLITNPEWMTIAANLANVGSNWSGGIAGSGELARGHRDTNPASVCWANASDANAWVDTN